jgi:hypothetical protein
MRTGTKAAILVPLNSVRKPVVTPKHFTIHNKSWGTEHAKVSGDNRLGRKVLGDFRVIGHRE